ncbi:MAG TPA: hypothetical protein VGI61_00565 [Parafilimonas sp.]
MSDFKIILMSAYKASLKYKDRIKIMESLNPQTTAFLYEKNCDTCYFIFPVIDTEIFFSSIPEINAHIEKVDITEIRDNCTLKTNYTIAGNSNLVPLNFAYKQ